MGFNTTVLVLNDRLREIEEGFVRELSRMAGSGQARGPVPRDFHGSQSGVIETHHADQTAVILVGGNTATVLGLGRGYRHNEPRNQVDALEMCLNALGYDIRRQTQKKLEGAIREAERKLQRAIQNDPSRGGTRSVEYSRFRSWEHEVGFYEKRLDWLREMKTTEESA